MSMITIDRRYFLLAAGALAASARMSFATGGMPAEILAERAKAQLAPAGYGATEVWAYNGTIPGEAIRVRRGERVTRNLVNRLDEATTIHWHGIRIDNAMDGAAHLTQEPVQPGESFLYDFVAPDAGTFWFHPHHETLEQVARGLAGPLIVEERHAPDADDDLVLMVNDWRLDADAQVVADFNNMMDRTHAGRIGNHITVNGLAEFVRPAKRNERLRLRVINAATDRVLTLGSTGLNAYIVALDGMPVDEVRPFERVVLAPAQRVDLMADITADIGSTAFLTSVERNGTFSLATFPVAGEAASSSRDTPNPLEPNGLPEIDLEGAATTSMVMAGGMMGAMPEGMHQHEMRDMMRNGQAWFLNGESGMPDEPMVRVARGESVRMMIDNQTAFAHAMHLHGHHFREVMPGGFGPARDTILVDARAQTEIAFVADNPGKWMFHCHMLAHQAAGMMTWLEVGHQA